MLPLSVHIWDDGDLKIRMPMGEWINLIYMIQEIVICEVMRARKYAARMSGIYVFISNNVAKHVF